MKEKQLLKTIVEGIQEKKGKKITTVDLSKIESAATSHFIDTSPCFSPTGEQIVFTSDRGGMENIYVILIV